MAKIGDYPEALEAFDIDSLICVQDGINKKVSAKKISGLDAIGVNQSWTDKTAVILKGVQYINNSGKPIILSCSGSGVNLTDGIGIFVNGVLVASTYIRADVNYPSTSLCQALIPEGQSYYINDISGVNTIISVMELS